MPPMSDREIQTLGTYRAALKQYNDACALRNTSLTDLQHAEREMKKVFKDFNVSRALTAQDAMLTHADKDTNHDV